MSSVSTVYCTYVVFVWDTRCVPRIECVLYIVCILLQSICTGPYRILPTQCVVNNPVSCWHSCQSSGWCYQALHRVSCVACCVFIISAGCLLGYIFCEYCTEFSGLDCTLPAQCDVYMHPVLSLHYCQRSMLCMFCSCCTTASTGCYVCLVCIALLPAQGVIYVLFVLHYCQHIVPLLNIASAVCRH